MFEYIFLTGTSNGYGATNGLGPGQGSLSGDFNCDAVIDELDNIRLREITGKAVSGSLLLLVKWLKRSRKSRKPNQLSPLTCN